MRIKLNKYKKAGNVSADVFQPISFESSAKEIVETDISRVVSQMDIYNRERDNSEIYRVSLIVRPLLTNILTNVTGDDSLSTFNNPDMRSGLNPLNAGLNVKDSLNYINTLFHLMEKENGWLGYYKPEGLSINTNFVELKPKKSELTIIDDDEYNNWDFSLYYIGSKENLFEHGGLPVIAYEKVNYGGNLEYTSILTGFNHNCKIGDKVYLGGAGNYSGEYEVLDIGLADNSGKEIYLVLDINGDFDITPETNIKKVINGYKCEYYKRILHKAPTKTDRELDKTSFKIIEAGFSRNYYDDLISNVMYLEDLDLNKVRDYRNRLPLDIVNITFKTLENKFGVNVFTNLKSGWDLEFSGYVNNNVIDARYINEITHDFTLDENVSITAERLTYDYCEFDRWNYTETSLNKVMYRFNTLNRQDSENRIIYDYGKAIDLGVRKEGYIYDPFHPFHIREESVYVEEGGEFDEIPYSAVELEPGYFRWRDVLTKSVTNTNTTPFLNGAHYLNGDYILFQKRQDPYGKYGLYHGEFPGDKFGELNKLLPTETIEDATNDEC